MRIGELEKDTTVTIHVTDGVKAVQLDSQVLDLGKEDQKICLETAKKLRFQSFLGIQAIMAGDRVVSFSSDKITCTVTALYKNKPYSWKEVKIVKQALPELGTIHMALSNDDVKSFNRRNEYRLFLGQEGSCRFGDSNELKKIFIKDISCSGMGIMINKSDDIEINVGMRIEAQFLSPGSDGNPQTYSVHGKIVRYVSMGNGRELVGCKLSGLYPELEKMIYERQRQSMTTDYKLQVKKESTKSLAEGFAALYQQDTEEP